MNRAIRQLLSLTLLAAAMTHCAFPKLIVEDENASDGDGDAGGDSGDGDGDGNAGDGDTGDGDGDGDGDTGDGDGDGDGNAGDGDGNAGDGDTGDGDGGSGDGDGDTGDGDGDNPSPTLITSSKLDYWVESEVTVGTGSASVSVDLTQKSQTWQGFGGAFNEQGWAVLQLLSQEDRDRAMRLLFDATDGIGFTWGRIPIGPSDYAVSRYSLSSGPGLFDLSNDEVYLIPYVQAALAVKNDIKFWAIPWTPPPWAKTGGKNGGTDAGTFNTQYFQEYADYFVDWIQAYKAKGIVIDHVQPQNQPGYLGDYPSCGFGSNDLGVFVDSYLSTTISKAGLSTKIWFGTLANDAEFSSYWAGFTGTPSGESKVAGVGLAWACRSRVGTLRDAGYLVMQSEHQGGNYPWLPAATDADSADSNSFLSSMAPNNHAYGEESWNLIKAWINEGVNIYNAWNMVLDTKGFSLDSARPWPQNALLTVDKSTNKLGVTPAYYVFRHIAQYVRPGARRVGVEGDALAFQNVDGSLVAVFYNSDTADQALDLQVGSDVLSFVVPSRGWATVNWPTVNP